MEKERMSEQRDSIRKKFKPNIGMFFFTLVFLYVAVGFYMSAKTSNIVGYQVKNGMLSENRIYTGIALRDEKTVETTDTGYVSLFLSEGDRVAYNDLVYSIDESGKLSEMAAKDPTVSNLLTEDELNSLKKEIQLFSRNFNNKLFSETYSFETKINNDLSKLENRRLFEDIEYINSLNSRDIINFYRAKDTGIVTYFFDGYENKSVDDLTPDDFERDNYESFMVMNDDLIEQGSNIYKYTQDENWSLCILVTNDELLRIGNMDYINVRFLKTQTESWGKVNKIKTTDKGSIVELTFTNSMVTFCKDRFVEIELLVEEDTGLKIPNSSIAEAPFFLIDKNYILNGYSDKSGSLGVYRKTMKENGESEINFVELTIYDESEDAYYVDMVSLSIGDVLTIPEGSTLIKDAEGNIINNPPDFTVGKQGTLVGVYNINKGFADFKKIEILYSNDEYSIISSNDTRGLKAYDYIALDAKIIGNKDFIY